MVVVVVEVEVVVWNVTTEVCVTAVVRTDVATVVVVVTAHLPHLVGQ